MEPLNPHRTRRSSRIPGCSHRYRAVTRLGSVHSQQLASFRFAASGLCSCLATDHWSLRALAQPRDNRPSAGVPKALAIPVILFGVVSSLATSIALVMAVSTRDDVLFNVRSMAALSLTFLSGVFVTWYVLRRNVGFVGAIRFRFSLRTLLVVMMVIPPAACVGWRLTVLLPAKRSYEEVRAEIAACVLTEMPMDAATERLLADVRDNWTQHSNELDGAYARALKTINRSASVSNLVDVLTYRMPLFSLLSPERNYEPAVIGTIQAVLLPTSVDGHIYVSEDRNRALIRVQPHVVFLFENDAQGMRETDWVLKVVYQQGCNDGSN